MEMTEKDEFREFIRKQIRMRWKHRKWGRNTQKLNKKEENDGYDEKQKKNNEWWDSERGMGGIGVKKDEKPEWREDQPTMIKKWTHSKQKKPRKLMETNEKQKKINRKEWNRWGLRIHKKIQGMKQKHIEIQ